MANFEAEEGTTRDDLVQRVALMEEMIAEGRRSTIRSGWIFVYWGVVCLSAIGWEILHPNFNWVWPITIAIGLVLLQIIILLRGKTDAVCGNSVRSRNIQAVWNMMGATATLYFVAAILQHKANHIAFVAAMLMFVGMAHAISAMILRWWAQGIVAVCWWAGGVAMFFVPGSYWMRIFVAEMVFGMIGFGLYAMWLEKHGRGERQGGRG